MDTFVTLSTLARERKMSFIVITGAFGFIGSCFVQYLNDLGIDNLVLVDDFKTSEKWKNLRKKRFQELVSRERVFSFLSGKEKSIEAIVHLGACSNTLEKDGDFLLENNYRFSIRLVEIALKEKIPFVYASSAATYGDGKHGFSDDESLLYRYEPLNLYGFSKHLFDLWLYEKQKLDQVVGLKYFNVFGPNENHKGMMASMVYKMAHKVKNEGVIQLFKSTEPHLYKDGEQLRDFIYVKDVVKMTYLLLEEAKKGKASGIFNIGRGEAVTWIRLAKALFRALDKKVCINYIDMPKEMVKGYQNYTKADMEKFLKICPSFSFTEIEDSVEDYVKNYLLQDARW